MTVMNVAISKDLEEFVRGAVKCGQFPTETAVLEEALRLLIHQAERAQSEPNNAGMASHRPIWAQALEAMQGVSDEELAVLPTDGAAQIDHYIYGTPKREQ